MSGRRTITAAMERNIILSQIMEGYIGTVIDPLTCFMHLTCACGCGLPILPETPVIREHVIPLALGGEDHYRNIRLYRKECALKKTNGPRHVKVDGDASKIAKAKRLAGERKPKRKRTWPSRALSSRPFQKRKEIRT